MYPAFCIYTLFSKQDKPLLTGILDVANDAVTLCWLYYKGTKTSIYEVEQRHKYIKKIISILSKSDQFLAINNFKLHLDRFKLELIQKQYAVFDLCQPVYKVPTTAEAAVELVTTELYRMKMVKLAIWQHAFANAAVVYQYLQEVGVKINGQTQYPTWSQLTYSGRSKTLGHNIQGMGINDGLERIGCSKKDIFIHFDWIAADIRVASILSEDKRLHDSFLASDPYTMLSEVLSDVHGSISRDECKTVLLRTINSLSPDNDAIEYFFPDLCKWLRTTEIQILQNGHSASVLGRRFYLSEARDNNPKAVFNAKMQGSVAHGMQITLRRIWEKYPEFLLVEIHDSLAMCCPKVDQEFTVHLIKEISKIMLHPFSGYLDSNPVFPVKISVGDSYKDWEYLTTFRRLEDVDAG